MCDTVNVKEKPEGSLESKVGKGTAAGPFILLPKVMAEITKATKGGEKGRGVSRLGGLRWHGQGCEVKMYLINWTLDGL